jgi:hypothetical protein
MYDAIAGPPRSTIASTMRIEMNAAQIDVPMANGNDRAVAITSCPVAASSARSTSGACACANAMRRHAGEHRRASRAPTSAEITAAEAGRDADADEPEQQPGDLDRPDPVLQVHGRDDGGEQWWRVPAPR